MNRLTARTEKGLAYLVNVKPDEQEWIRKVREELKPPPTPMTTCERCPMTRNAGGGHMMTLCVAGNCLLNKREVTE